MMLINLPSIEHKTTNACLVFIGEFSTWSWRAERTGCLLLFSQGKFEID